MDALDAFARRVPFLFYRINAVLVRAQEEHDTLTVSEDELRMRSISGQQTEMFVGRRIVVRFAIAQVQAYRDQNSAADVYIGYIVVLASTST